MQRDPDGLFDLLCKNLFPWYLLGFFKAERLEDTKLYSRILVLKLEKLLHLCPSDICLQ